MGLTEMALLTVLVEGTDGTDRGELDSVAAFGALPLWLDVDFAAYSRKGGTVLSVEAARQYRQFEHGELRFGLALEQGPRRLGWNGWIGDRSTISADLSDFHRAALRPGATWSTALGEGGPAVRARVGPLWSAYYGTTSDKALTAVWELSLSASVGVEYHGVYAFLGSDSEGSWLSVGAPELEASGPCFGLGVEHPLETRRGERD